MRLLKTFLCLMLLISLGACAKVDITKTSEGYFDPTNPASVKILKTVPEEAYTELGTVTVSGFKSSDTAKMHNAVRAKAASLGANAVILTDEGLVPLGWGNYEIWATGVAVHYN